MAFDIKKFYEDLDGYYARYDNAATEQFLKDSLAATEDFMIIHTACSSCQDHSDHTAEEEYEKLTDEEKKWILDCSDSRIAVLNEMACFYRGISEFDKCLYAFDSVKQELENRGMENNNAYAVVILNMAGAYRLMGRLDEALETFKKAEAIMLGGTPAGDYEFAGLYNNTGLVYQDMDKLDLAAEYFEKALGFLEKVEDNEAEIATNNANLAVTYFRLGKNDSALACLDKALGLFSELDGGMNPHYAGALNTKAVILARSGKFAESAEVFTLAAEKTKLIFGESKDYATIISNAAYVYAQAGNQEAADKYQAEANAILSRLG